MPGVSANTHECDSGGGSVADATVIACDGSPDQLELVIAALADGKTEFKVGGCAYAFIRTELSPSQCKTSTSTDDGDKYLRLLDPEAASILADAARQELARLALAQAKAERKQDGICVRRSAFEKGKAEVLTRLRIAGSSRQEAAAAAKTKTNKAPASVAKKTTTTTTAAAAAGRVPAAPSEAPASAVSVGVVTLRGAVRLTPAPEGVAFGLAGISCGLGCGL